MKEQLTEMFRLQQLDSGVDAMKREFAALDPGRTEREVYEQTKASHNAALEALTALQTNLQDTQLERKSVEEKHDREEKRLYSGSVRVPKELTALQDEVAMLQRRMESLNEKISQLSQETEAAKANEETAKQTLRKAVTTLKARQEAYKQRAEEIATQGRTFAAQRIEQAKRVPPTLLQRYEKLRSTKSGIAVAPLEDGNACGGCKMGLPSSIVGQVHEARNITLCDNCGRILVEKAE